MILRATVWPHFTCIGCTDTGT